MWAPASLTPAAGSDKAVVMLKGRARKALWNRLVGAGMNPVAATEVASAAYPTKKDEPMRAPELSPEQAVDAIERALAGDRPIDGDALFEQVFGISWDDYSADHLG